MQRKILIWPDELLSKKSEPVEKIDSEIKVLIADMLDTMQGYEEGAAGIAAPQVGVNKRIFIVDIPKEDNHGNGTEGPLVLINPEFVEKSDEKFTWTEGCLSIPGLQGKVTRKKRVVMRYTDITGKTQSIEGLDYLAGALQHEHDHLEGILWVDHQGKLSQQMIRKKMIKLKNSFQED